MKILKITDDTTHFINLDHVAQVEVGVLDDEGQRVVRIWYAFPGGEWLLYEDFDGDAAMMIERTMQEIAYANSPAP